MNELNENKVLMILGMHRSGTSLFTNWLHDCGLHVGDRLLGEGIGNENGHFEDLDFFELHTYILHKNENDWVFKNQSPIQISTYGMNKAKITVELKNRLYKNWGWKEPRTCLFLDMWDKIIPNAKKIVLFRSFEETVQSLIKRDLIDLMTHIKGGLKHIKRFNQKRKFLNNVSNLANTYLNTWCVYNEQLLHHYKDDPEVLFINSNQLIELEKKIFHFLTQKLEFDLDYKNLNTIYKTNLWNNRKSFSISLTNEHEKRAQNIYNELNLIQNKRFDKLL